MLERKVNQLLVEYLDLMQTLPPPSIDLMKVLTLRELRERRRASNGRKISKTSLGKVLNRTRGTIADWEDGLHLDGVTTEDLLKMANLFNCRVEEVVAVVENTRMLTEEEPANLHITNN